MKNFHFFSFSRKKKKKRIKTKNVTVKKIWKIVEMRNERRKKEMKKIGKIPL